jgi:hypothetical protein
MYGCMCIPIVLFTVSHIIEAGQRLIVKANNESGAMNSSRSGQSTANKENSVGRMMLHSLSEMNEQLREICRKRRLLQDELKELRYVM